MGVRERVIISIWALPAIMADDPVTVIIVLVILVI